MFLRKRIIGTLILTLGLVAFDSKATFARESTLDKVQNDLDDTKTHVKKSVRKHKRHIRNATGRGSVVKDTQDKLHDFNDDASNEFGKTKRRLK